MVHSRQDNTDENEKKIEFLLQKYSWKWDVANIGAMLILLIFLYNLYFVNILHYTTLVSHTFSLNEQSRLEDVFDYFFTKTNFNKPFTDVIVLKQIVIFTNELLSKSIHFFQLI
jgi:hypothetical protein